MDQNTEAQSDKESTPNNNIYVLDVGYRDPTIIYELRPVKVATLPPFSTRIDMERRLKELGATNIIVDAGWKLDDYLVHFRIIRDIHRLLRIVFETDKEKS